MSEKKLTPKVIVTDTGPLISLVAGGSLDLLLVPRLPVFIPDAVLYEATRRRSALGAEAIFSWVRNNLDQVHEIPTQAHIDFLEWSKQVPTHKEKDLGERAAIEVIRYVVKLKPEERALLITEDDWTLRGPYLIAEQDRRKMIPMTTYDYLSVLESEGRIKSANEIYDRIDEAGRLASQARVLGQEPTLSQKAVKTLIRDNMP